MRVIIDRFEEDKVVLEYNGETFAFPRVLMPREAQEGDMVILSATLDPEATAEQKKKIDQLMNDLFQD